MRTTINLDDDVYELASAYASARGVTLGTAIGELVRKNNRAGLSDEFLSRIRIGGNGLPFVASSGKILTSEMVKTAEEDEIG